MEPLHDAGDMHKAKKPDVELVKAGGHAAKDLTDRKTDRKFNSMRLRIARDWECKSGQRSTRLTKYPP